MYDSDLAVLLRRRLRQVQEADITTRFGASSLAARFSSLTEELAALPVADYPILPGLLERLQRLEQQLAQQELTDQERAERLQWPLVDLLQLALRQLR
jgi:hypothetical protein